MISYLHRGREKLGRLWGAVRGCGQAFKQILRDQLNKNIYTRILFTNVTVFLITMIGLIFFSSHMVKQVAYDQAQQELLRKAKRINFALLQQTNQNMGDGEVPAWQAQSRQELLNFLADIFDTRITVFDREGTILDTSAAQEVLPGSKIEREYVELFKGGQLAISRVLDPETGQYAFIAVVPMGNNMETLENGILLESQSINTDLALNRMRLFLVAGGVALLVVVIFVSVYLAMSISRPISRLAAMAADTGRGSYLIIPEEQTLDEINALAGQLNNLSLRLQRIQSESSAMEEEKARLFAEISHELRTPLTAVQGFVEAIRDGIVQDEAVRQRYLDTIYTQTVHISRLVDDLLVLSRLESGTIAVEKLPVDLIALAEGVAASMETEAARKNTSIRLKKEIDQAIIIGDVDRVEQILRNLIKNALRVTENGTIIIGVERRQETVCLSISDTGSGIPPEDLPHIWDRFYRVRNQRDSYRGEEGSGLGLVIVKKLVQLLDGQIEVSSRLGEGTVFTLSFPLFKPRESCNIC
ncbi:MAG TPA: HAMP domain-containing sensor histidine kinase [Bacillota bacterium]|nr:HAMP domain-containing sensor histidine kinase [Bacillota bacterium]